MPNNPDIILVFIGESGAGKSTCINYFANFFAQTGFSQDIGYSKIQVVIPNRLFPSAANGFNSGERNVNDKTMSQTMYCKEYDFTWSTANNQTRIKIVDTPGFNDTDSKRDDNNIQEILKTIANLPFITGILITINGTNSRLSTSVKSALEQLRSSLPDSIFNNLFFILTNCTEDGCNFDLKLIQEYSPDEERIFYMQNSLFSVESRDVIEQNAKNARRAETNWNESMDTITDIMTKMKQIGETSTQVFDDMRTKREQIVVHKENLIEKQKSLLNIMHAIKTEQERLLNAQNDREANQNYTTTRMIEQIDLVTKEYYSTICTEHGKVSVCHERCGLHYKSEVNFEHFKNCAAADSTGNNCKRCKCGMNQHLHAYEIPVARMVELDEVIQSKKAAFDSASSDEQTIQGKLHQLAQTHTQFQNETIQCKQGILTAIRDLKQICSRFNFAEMMQTTIDKLRQEQRIARDLQAKQEFSDTADAIEQLIRQLK
ncbi:unnamed protein product [Adineta ricciae]|uniref:G domain-containing protein n=1 Tax=Adineta ricciae TaxID=249248 RepID=A0A813R380_ADIRI|nr:unnamed protein product [Adineta ricciae]CAF1165023.1 unnamed protein product [Adineta ricciae]